MPEGGSVRMLFRESDPGAYVLSIISRWSFEVFSRLGNLPGALLWRVGSGWEFSSISPGARAGVGGGKPRGPTADPTCRGPKIPRSSAAQQAKRQPQLASESNPKAAHAGTVTSEADRKIACTDAGHRTSLRRTITTPLQCAILYTNVRLSPFLSISSYFYLTRLWTDNIREGSQICSTSR